MKSAKTLEACKIIAVVGICAFVVGLFINGLDADDLRTAGAVVAISGITGLLSLPLWRSHNDMYQAGQDDGYERGFHEGRETVRPVVVSLRDRMTS